MTLIKEKLDNLGDQDDNNIIEELKKKTNK